MRILIVGAGLGGMMLAAALEQRGVAYELIEQAPEGTGQGYSLGVWCNTRSIFKKLGLQDQFDLLGTRIHTYDICDSSGSVLKAFRFDDFYSRFGMAYTQVNRQELRQLLVTRIDPSRLSYGTELLGVSLRSEVAEVSFSNGEKKEYDVVVGADGVHSSVREHAFGKSLQSFTGWRAWYVWIDKKFGTPHGMTEYLGPGRCLGIFDEGERALAIFFTPRAPEPAARRAGQISYLKAIFWRELACIPGALDNSTDDEVMATDLAIVRMIRWIRGPVVLLGDAAHAFEPHTGLGASMAMEGACVLAGELARVSHGYPLTSALNNYQSTREPRVEIARRLNRNIRKFAFIKSRALRAIANRLIPFVPERLFTKDYYSLFEESALDHGKEMQPNATIGQFVEPAWSRNSK